MKIFFLLLLLISSLHAQEKRLELGLGIGALRYPSYIGSKSYHSFIAPLPYIRYRGKRFRLDENGLNGKLLGVEGLRIDLSVSGALPAESESDDARAGMPDLDLTGEVGFQLIYRLYHEKEHTLEIEFPIRSVLSTNFNNLKYRGIVSNPQLKYMYKDTHFKMTLRVGAIFGDADYFNYYYGVSEEYVTPTRGFYDAKSGFGGIRSRIGMRYKVGSWWFGGFCSYFDIQDATFSDTPLVETKHAIYSGISAAYIFYTSE